MKKIIDIREIWDGNNLLIKEFVDLDLSSLDLSIIPMECFNDCKFHNTNFESTNIKFNPRKLRLLKAESWNNTKWVTSIRNCNFRNCDLSYLNISDMKNVRFNGCNFENTHLRFNLLDLSAFENIEDRFEDDCLDIRGVTLDQSFSYYLNDLRGLDYYLFDLSTIEKNPTLSISSVLLLNLISKLLPKKNIIQSVNKINEYISICEDLLKYDKEGYLKQLYFYLKDNFNVFNEYKFFQKEIYGLDFTNFNLGSIPKSLLNQLEFTSCTFNNTILENNLWEIEKLDMYDNTNVIKSIIMPSINVSSWMDNTHNRLGNSPLTFRTNLYLELDRACNAKCPFCRNNSFSYCKYDLNNIKSSLLKLYPYLNDIVIGGGEPTLRLDDIEELMKYISMNQKHKAYWYIFTNGTLDFQKMMEFYQAKHKIYLGYNISRHAISDEENAKIFQVSENNILNTSQLKKIGSLYMSTNTLCATCFKGALDNLQKITEYLEFAMDCGFKQVLLSSLHKDSSLGNQNLEVDLNIDENVFDEVKDYLRKFDFKEKRPIYSTGGYKSTVFTNSKITIAFKEYITKEDLELNFPKALKRTFDLSIDPTGRIYENWHQTSGEVKRVKVKY